MTSSCLHATSTFCLAAGLHNIQQCRLADHTILWLVQGIKQAQNKVQGRNSSCTHQAIMTSTVTINLWDS